MKLSVNYKRDVQGTRNELQGLPFWLLKGVPKSVEVGSESIEAVMALTLIILK